MHLETGDPTNFANEHRGLDGAYRAADGDAKPAAHARDGTSALPPAIGP